MTPDLYVYRAYVTKVYDGDSITVDFDLGMYVTLRKQKIRLIGINAPEVRGEQREQGLISRDRLREKILDKWVVIQTQKDKKGKYGRWLGTIWLEEENINNWLLKTLMEKPMSFFFREDIGEIVNSESGTSTSSISSSTSGSSSPRRCSCSSSSSSPSSYSPLST